MSDVAAPAAEGSPTRENAPGLPQMILDAPEPLWKKLSVALGVATRQDAVRLVLEDESAAAMAAKILQGSLEETALTEAPQASIPETALTSPPKKRSAEERLYGGKAKLNIA